MAKRVQRFAQVTGVAASFIGLAHELIVDTGLNAIRVHDGATPGGHLTLMADRNLSDITDANAARTNLGIPLPGSDPNYLAKAANLADLNNEAAARINLGLGTAAQLDIGTSGGVLGPLNANLTWSGTQVFSAGVTFNAGVAIPGGINGNLTLGAQLVYGGVTLTAAVTGTGRMVLDNSPTLITPNLGIPSAGVLTNCTGIPAAQLTGTISVNRFNGGTNADASHFLRGDGTWAIVNSPITAISTDITVTPDAVNTFTHGLGGVPNILKYELVCQTGGDQNYNAGDVIQIHAGPIDTGSDSGISVVVTATTVVVAFGHGPNVFTYLSLSAGSQYKNGNLTNSKWKLRITAIRTI